MIYYLTFKTPDALDQIMQDVNPGEERDKLLALAERYIKYEECVTLILDTEKMSVTIKEV